MPTAPHDELDLLIGKMKTAAAPLRDVLRELHARYAPVDEGKVADYIPDVLLIFTICHVSVELAGHNSFQQAVVVPDYLAVFVLVDKASVLVTGCTVEDMFMLSHGLLRLCVAVMSFAPLAHDRLIFCVVLGQLFFVLCD